MEQHELFGKFYQGKNANEGWNQCSCGTLHIVLKTSKGVERKYE